LSLGAGAFQPAALQAPANDAHKIVALLQGTTGRDAGLSHRPKSSPAQQPLAEATPHRGGGPLRADAYYAHPRPVRTIDQRVRTDFVVNIRNVDLRCRQPLQGPGYIAGPDAPCGTVSEFHQMAPIVFFDLHRRSPV